MGPSTPCRTRKPAVPAGHERRPCRHTKSPKGVETESGRHPSSFFLGFRVPQSGFSCRVAAMHRIAEARPVADVCLHTNPPTARRARAQSRAATRFVVARQRPLCVSASFAALREITQPPSRASREIISPAPLPPTIPHAKSATSAKSLLACGAFTPKNSLRLCLSPSSRL